MKRQQNKTAPEVKTYYEKNTSKFLRFQRRLGQQNIHQPLWANSGFSQTDAINYSNALIKREIESLQTQRQISHPIVFDLGCGVGGALFYLAQQLRKPGQLFGLSISAKQIELAQQANRILNLQDKCTFLEADFHALPQSLPSANLAYAIEAFVHAYDADRFFAGLAEKLQEGGRLVIIDDFLTEKKNLDREEKAAIARFEYGWVLGSLYPVNVVTAKARENGLERIKNLDLTPYLSVFTLKERLIRFYVRLMRPVLKKSEYFKSLIGGDARQYCLQKGLIEYRMLVFEKK